MNYRLTIRGRAQRAIGRLPARDMQRVRAAIARLATTPRPVGCLKLTDRSAWRIRIGSYRVIYEIDDDARSILIVDVADRKTIYP